MVNQCTLPAGPVACVARTGSVGASGGGSATSTGPHLLSHGEGTGAVCGLNSEVRLDLDYTWLSDGLCQNWMVGITKHLRFVFTTDAG